MMVGVVGVVEGSLGAKFGRDSALGLQIGGSRRSGLACSQKRGGFLIQAYGPLSCI